jgi:hypothetical protein
MDVEAARGMGKYEICKFASFSRPVLDQPARTSVIYCRFISILGDTQQQLLGRYLSHFGHVVYGSISGGTVVSYGTC